VVAWTFLILLSSLIPGREMPNIDAPDKVVHIVLYFVYTFLIARYLLKRNPARGMARSFSLSLMYSIVFGAIIELVQAYYIPMRNGDIMDFAANTAGSLLAWPIFIIIHRKS
jgi:VanZ family protein